MLNPSRVHLGVDGRIKSNKGYGYTQIISQIFPPNGRKPIINIEPNVQSEITNIEPNDSNPLRDQQSDLMKYPNHTHGSTLSIPSTPQSRKRVCTSFQPYKKSIILC